MGEKEKTIAAELSSGDMLIVTSTVMLCTNSLLGSTWEGIAPCNHSWFRVVVGEPMLFLNEYQHKHLKRCVTVLTCSGLGHLPLARLDVIAKLANT